MGSSASSTWPLERQMEVFDKLCHRAAADVIKRLKANRPAIIELARERTEGVGFETYGEEAYHLPYDEAMLNIDEELADAIARRVTVLARGWV